MASGTASLTRPSTSGCIPRVDVNAPAIGTAIAPTPQPEDPEQETAGGSDSQGPSIPPGSQLPHGASADLRTVQASLDRFQGSRSKRSSEGDGPLYSYNAERVLGSGAFGIVYQAKINETGEMVAIKKVLQDARFKNRELEIMQELKHPNVVELKSFFHVAGEKPKENYLNVVMEYCPETMQGLMTHYTKMRQKFPYISVQLYTYHMLRGVAYMNAKNICHRDIKPPNLLVNKDTHELKLCDFGSAKRLSKGEPNVAYICSRYYRAPELIFGATEYSPLIDMWSLACVTAEMILQQVLFPGDSGVDQLMEIIKVLGTPTRDELESMNPVYGEFKFPQIKSYPWKKIFRSRTTPEAVDLLSKVLQYDPKKRPTGLQACMHAFFDTLRSPSLHIETPLSMFWFSDEELALTDEAMRKVLIPEWVNVQVPEQGGTVPRDLGLCQRPEASKAKDAGSSDLADSGFYNSTESRLSPETQTLDISRTASKKPDIPKDAKTGESFEDLPSAKVEPVTPKTPKTQKKTRPRTRDGDATAAESESGERMRKVASEPGESSSSRRRKRDGREKLLDAPSPLPTTANESPPVDEAGQPHEDQETDPLADFSHAMQSKSYTNGSANSMPNVLQQLDAQRGAGRRTATDRERGSGSVPETSRSVPCATPRNPQPLLSAGAMQLAPAVAVTQLQR